MTLLPVVIVIGAVALFVRCTVFSGLRVRRMKWRTLARTRPGPGFATLPEMWWRWGKLAPVRYGRRTRPSMGLWRRIRARPTEFAYRLGRGPYLRRCYATAEAQPLIIAPPRTAKTGMLGDLVIDWPGAVLTHDTRPGMYFGTAGYRNQLRGPVMTFNPDQLGGIPSTFRWAMTAGCADPAEALYRAADLVGAATAGETGEMKWWVEKAQTALAAGVHAAGLLTGSGNTEVIAAAAIAAGLQAAALEHADMGDVWEWAYGGGKALIQTAARHPDASPALFGALTELERPTRSTDSVRMTMSKSLYWLAVPALRDMVTGPTARPFDVPGWLDRRGTIYMISPGGDAAPAAPLFRAFTSYCRRQAIIHAASQPQGRLDPGVLFALDEIHACPVDLPHWLADSGGSGVQIAPVIHSTGQLEDKYGKAGLDTVWSTTTVKIFLPGIQEVRTLQDVSVLCGTLPGGEARGLDPIVPVEFLRQLPNWRALVINGNLAPVVVRVRPYWHRIRTRLGLAPALPRLYAPLAAVPDGEDEVSLPQVAEQQWPVLTGSGGTL
jgi:type IV secretion system protein VirD4